MLLNGNNLDKVSKKGITAINKKIVIDTNNYMYKFLSEDKLIDGFMYMCALFKCYNIMPLFIFDGKAPVEKMEEIIERRTNRKKFKEIYKNVKNNLNEMEKIEMKRKIVKVTEKDATIIKKIIEAYGMKHIVSPGESDELCCKLVNSGKVYACMSEDTDLFAYGCTNIIKCINIHKETFIMYNIEKLLNYYDITMNNFQNICSLSSNDYYKGKNNKHFIYYFELYKSYLNNNNNNSFMEWIKENNFITNNELTNFIQNKEQYNLHNKNILSGYKYIVIRNSKYDKKGVLKLVDMRNYYLSSH